MKRKPVVSKTPVRRLKFYKPGRGKGGKGVADTGGVSSGGGGIPSGGGGIPSGGGGIPSGRFDDAAELPGDLPGENTGHNY